MDMLPATQQLLLESQWSGLCERYLPKIGQDSIWRYSRHQLPGDPDQGWKLHVAATVLSAVKVFEAVAPLLSERQILFKGPKSLDELDKLNSGIFYGYSQVGKFLTVYPHTTQEAMKLARELHKLTRGFDSPVIPFDSRYKERSCVNYRYGAFKTMEIEEVDGTRTQALRDHEGKLVPDKRDSEHKPTWVVDPFPRGVKKPKVTKLQTTFRAFGALAQRGRGGVYQAVDLSVNPPRLCVIKQGRRHGEVSFDGRDGAWRIKHEKSVLTYLRRSGISVPRVYSSFREEKTYYLVIEFIEGENLQDWLIRRKRRLTVAHALKRSVEVARLVARIHALGWVWRDCKPGNIIVTKDGALRPLDFEGACPVTAPDPMAWGTEGFAPPEVGNPFRGQQRTPEDLYALGAIIYFLMAGILPDESARIPLEKMRKKVPAAVIDLVTELLAEDPERRPSAEAATHRLEAALDRLTNQD
jgi:hypothetical protein